MINGLMTFISAFESLPIHCEKSRPSGKHHRPGNAGTAEMLHGFNYQKMLERRN